ncbi:MAG: DUF6788 family protein [Spirochaetota bacterium]
MHLVSGEMEIRGIHLHLFQEIGIGCRCDFACCWFGIPGLEKIVEIQEFPSRLRRKISDRQGVYHTGPRHYLVVNEDGQQRQKYIPNSQVEAAREGLEQYRRLREVIERITQLNLALMKEGDYARQ